MIRYFITAHLVIFTFICSAQNMNFLTYKDTSTCLKEYENFLHFKYESNILLKKDNEAYEPIAFEIDLPKKLKYWEVINSSSFGFYYSHKQVIFISTNIFKNTIDRDTVYTPTRNEIAEIIDKFFYTSGHPKWDIKNIEIMGSRENLILKEGSAIILMFNVKDSLFKDYYRFVQSYKSRQ